jgi:hypothetical protein
MAQRFIEPIARIFTNAGAVGVGYKYYQEVDDFKGPSYYTDWDELEACGCEKSWEHLKIDPNSWS